MRNNKEYQFQVLTNTGNILLKSEGYSTLLGCKNGISSVRRNAGEEKRYDRKNNKSGGFYFNLKAGNGQIVATSNQYAFSEARELDIVLLINHAYDAKTEELI